MECNELIHPFLTSLQPDLPVHPFDKRSLVLDVFIDVIGVQGGAFFLDTAVLCDGFGVAAEVVPERNMPFEFVGIPGTDIQMVLPEMSFSLVFKGFAAGDAEVAFMGIANRLQSGYDIGQNGSVLNDNVDVDHGFG